MICLISIAFLTLSMTFLMSVTFFCLASSITYLISLATFTLAIVLYTDCLLRVPS
jgi:hypothetical protein